jgi:hypothetical protein
MGYRGAGLNDGVNKSIDDPRRWFTSDGQNRDLSGSGRQSHPRGTQLSRPRAATVNDMPKPLFRNARPPRGA